MTDSSDDLRETAGASYKHSDRPLIDELDLRQFERYAITLSGTHRTARLTSAGDDVVVTIARSYGGFDVTVERTVQKARQSRVARALKPGLVRRVVEMAFLAPAKEAISR